MGEALNCESPFRYLAGSVLGHLVAFYDPYHVLQVNVA